MFPEDLTNAYNHFLQWVFYGFSTACVIWIVAVYAGLSLRFIDETLKG